MNRLTQWAARWLQVIVGDHRDELSVQIVNQHPDPERLTDQCIFVVRSGRLMKHLTFPCPGHCGENLLLSLDTKKDPHWQLRIDWRGRPTLSPSVRHHSQCESHFWIRDGRVLWCHD